MPVPEGYRLMKAGFFKISDGSGPYSWDGTRFHLPAGTSDVEAMKEPRVAPQEGWRLLDSGWFNTEDGTGPYAHDGQTFSLIGTGTTGLGTVSVNTQRETAYTLVSTDLGKIVAMDTAQVNTVTVPGANVKFPVGTRILLAQMGQGQTTVAPAPGVQVQSRGGRMKLNGQWARAELYKHSANVWVLAGDLVV